MNTSLSYCPFAAPKASKKAVNEKSKEKFLGVCKCCKQTLTYILGTNVVACKNAECKGIKHTTTDKDGVEKVYYTPYTRLLDETGLKIAENLFY